MEGVDVAVESVEEVGEGTVALDLKTPDGFDAAPGQFVQIARDVDGERVTRHYTLSSARVDGSFEVTVGIDPEGELSPVLAALGVGDEVAVDGPYGRAYYEGEPRVVVLAGGPGVGPAVGIGERAADEHGASNVAVVYVDGSPAHMDRLNALRDAGATVEVLDDASRLADATARALDATRGGKVGAEAQVFVYGFADFVETADDALEAAGYEGEAKVENFG